MNTPDDRPPRLARMLLRACLHPVDADVVLGDLHETYAQLASRYGRREARQWYWRQVVRSMPRFAVPTVSWSLVMLKNYLKIAFRHVRRESGHALINLLGLSVGIGCALLVFLYVQDELRYDLFHENADRIVRVTATRGMPELRTSANTERDMRMVIRLNALRGR